MRMLILYVMLVITSVGGAVYRCVPDMKLKLLNCRLVGPVTRNNHVMPLPCFVAIYPLAIAFLLWEQGEQLVK